jgi:hypothetical protein
MVSENSNNILLFNNYGEYLHLTRPLSAYQKTKLFDSLPVNIKKELMYSYEKDNWRDLIDANNLDQKIDFIKKHFNKDIIDIRIKINSGEKVRVKKVFWTFVEQELSSISQSRKSYLIGGVSHKVDPFDSKWIILEKKES